MGDVEPKGSGPIGYGQERKALAPAHYKGKGGDGKRRTWDGDVREHARKMWKDKARERSAAKSENAYLKRLGEEKVRALVPLEIEVKFWCLSALSRMFRRLSWGVAGSGVMEEALSRGTCARMVQMAEVFETVMNRRVRLAGKEGEVGEANPKAVGEAVKEALSEMKRERQERGVGRGRDELPLTEDEKIAAEVPMDDEAAKELEAEERLERQQELEAEEKRLSGRVEE